jgi:hypothetical protein
MINKITTYDELMLEKARLQALMKMHKEQIHQDFREIQEELVPVKNIINTISKFTSRESGNLLMTGTANTVIDFVLKKFLLAKTGWVSRVVLPFLAKNYASHFLADNKGNIIQKLASLFKKKPRPGANGNGKMHHVVDEEE